MGLWGEVVCTVAYCVNRTPTANGGVTPIQAFEGITPDISHMRIFYSDAYIHHSKLGWRCVFGKVHRISGGSKWVQVL